MDITVLAYLEPDDKEPDIAVRQVAAGLAERGHKTSILTIRHDVNELIAGLKQRKPQLVFNLVESFGDDIIGGVIGVQFGTRVGARLRGEELRALLAILVVAVALRLLFGLIVPPTEFYSVAGALP